MEPHIDYEEGPDTGTEKGAELWFAITASEHERARYGGPDGSLTVTELQDHIRDVWLLKERLADFYVNKLPAHAQLQS